MSQGGLLKAVALAIGCIASGTSLAGGFMLTEQSALGAGRAHAGAGIVGDDASAAWYNPAGMTLLPGTRVQTGAVLAILDLEYKGHTGWRDNANKEPSVIPNFHMTHELGNGLWAGLAVDVPYGMATQYNRNFEARKHGLNAKVLACDINPSIAYRFDDVLSVGVGATVQIAKATFENGSLAEYSGRFSSDYEVGYGVNAGVMISPSDKLRFGLSWRSSLHYNLGGNFQVRKLEGAVISQEDATLKFNTPQTIMATAFWQTTDRLALTATARWADWSTFSSMNVKTPRQDHETIMNCRDNWLLSVGADYRIDDAWTVRGGLGYETGIVREHRYRLATIPDDARLWAGVGASYRIGGNWQVDASYLLLKGLGDNLITKDRGNDEVIGDIKHALAHMIGVQVQYRF